MNRILLLLLLRSLLQHILVTSVKCVVFFTMQFRTFSISVAHVHTVCGAVFVCFFCCCFLKPYLYIWINQNENERHTAAASGGDVVVVAIVFVFIYFYEHVPSSFGKHRNKQPIKLIWHSVCALLSVNLNVCEIWEFDWV